MYNDIRASLEASLTGQTYQPDTGKLRTKLKENVENYAKSREIELGEAQQTVLNTYLEQAAEHIAANALYQIEVNHVDQVVFDAKMVRELLG